MCTTNCKYLEAAPDGWKNPGSDPKISWSTDTTNRSTAVTGADGNAIGTGYKNSLDIVAQTGNVAASSAAVAAREYGGGSKNDWFLPSKDELNQMCKWARGITGAALTNLTTVCTGGILNSGLGAAGFVVGTYWSSSEYSATHALSQYFGNGGQDNNTKGSTTVYVRPVRAF
jgi:hypothetical protein